MKKFVILTIAALALGFSSARAETSDPLATRDGRLAWWRDARFGMFIHWGPVSLTGGELSWSRANSNTNSPNNGETPVEVYDNLYKRFNPTNFNAEEWVHIAKTTGMKYMVLTAKHADGFLLWKSKVDLYNIGATPFNRDICAELAAAEHRAGMRVGWYFSEMDWRDPDCRTTNNDRFVARFQAELRELLSNYGRIDDLWFDSDGRPDMWHPAETYALVRDLQSKIVINNRLEMNSDYAWRHQGNLKPNEDYYTPEQRIGAYDDTTPWETCMTIGTQWSFKPNDQIKSTAQVIHILATCVGGDGNLLLDVGPMPDGRIEPRVVDVLHQVGAWMDKNGNSIYGTRGGPWKPNKKVASTRLGDDIFVHVLSWDGDSIELPGLPVEIKSATLLASGDKVQFVQVDGKVRLTVPETARDASDTVIKLKLKSSAMSLAAIETREQIKARASNIYLGDDTYSAEKAFDEDDGSRWATDNGTKQAWITEELQQPVTIHGVHIAESYDRVQKFSFEYRDGNEWKPIFTGTAIGGQFEKTFSPVTAREFRLNITDATAGPTISEIELIK